MYENKHLVFEFERIANKQQTKLEPDHLACRTVVCCRLYEPSIIT